MSRMGQWVIEQQEQGLLPMDLTENYVTQGDTHGTHDNVKSELEAITNVNTTTTEGEEARHNEAQSH